MSHVFISYSKKNRDYARKLADHLLSLGFDVWIDDRIDYGDMWERTIFKAIEDCAVFLVIMTPESYASNWVLREINYADRRKKPQFPLLLAGEEFPRYTITQYANVTDGNLPREDFYKRLTQVVHPKPDVGIIVTPSVAEPLTTISDPELAYEIANPPAPDTAATSVVKSVSKSNNKRMLFGITGINLIGIVIAVFLVGLALIVASSFNNLNPPVPTRTQQIVQVPTEAPTSTSTITESPIPTLSSTEVEGTIQGEMGIAQTDIASTQLANLALETANAIATNARSAADQTTTATQFTITPTIDVRATALARIAETQAAATQSVLDQTATATQWTRTLMPTITLTLTSTYTPSLTPNAQQAAQTVTAQARITPTLTPTLYAPHDNDVITLSQPITFYPSTDTSSFTLPSSGGVELPANTVVKVIGSQSKPINGQIYSYVTLQGTVEGVTIQTGWTAALATAAQATVTAHLQGGVTIRKGPGQGYERVGIGLKDGERAIVLGQATYRNLLWYYIDPENPQSSSGWIYAGVKGLQIDGNTSNVPQRSYPPEPTQSP